MNAFQRSLTRGSVVALFAILGGCNAGQQTSAGALPVARVPDGAQPDTVIKIPVPFQPGWIASDGTGADWVTA